jgi:PPM family protein phosphatase
VVVVNEERVFGVSAGDSSAWGVNGSTIDDLTAGQQRKPLIGSGAASPVTFDRPVRPGTLIVSTDGLFKYVTRERIATAVTSSDTLPER